jgi:hypothetical protein
MAWVFEPSRTIATALQPKKLKTFFSSEQVFFPVNESILIHLNRSSKMPFAKFVQRSFFFCPRAFPL